MASDSVKTSAEEKNDKLAPSLILGLACFVALACPFLFGYGTLPLTNFAGEIVSAAGFGVLLIVAVRYGNFAVGEKNPELIVAIFALLIAATLIQYLYFSSGYLTVWLTLVGYFILAGLATLIGWAARAGKYKNDWQKGVFVALVIGAALAALASLAQYIHFDASWAVISPSAEAGRTFGFVRQPNHQGTFLCLGLVALFALQPFLRWRLATAALIAFSPLLVFGIVSTGSRTALLQLLVVSVCAIPFLKRNGCGVWKAFYPLLFAALIWLALFSLSKNGGFDFYGVNKLTQTRTEGVGVRVEVWRQTLNMILARPWFGWGLLDYGSAFYVNGAAEKSGLVMVHSHNLFLQIAFAFGLPITLLLVLMTGKVLLHSRTQLASGEGFFPVMLLICVFIHSQVELPLWYTYFLLPACYCLGWLAFGDARQATEKLANPAGSEAEFREKKEAFVKEFAALAGVGVIGIVLWMNNDYYRLTPVFTSGLKSDFAERLSIAKSVTWFRQYSDYLSIVRQPVNRGNYDQFLVDASRLGCVMFEPWQQSNMIVALTYAGRIDEAKWLLYSYWRLSGGNVAHFKDALGKSGAPLAPEVIRYLNTPEPVPKATLLFDSACFNGKNKR